MLTVIFSLWYIPFVKYRTFATHKKCVYGNSLEVQRLSSAVSLLRAHVQSLTGKQKSHTSCGSAMKKKKKKVYLWQLLIYIFSSSLFPFSLLVFSTYDFLILVLILFFIILANIFNYHIQGGIRCLPLWLSW